MSQRWSSVHRCASTLNPNTCASSQRITELTARIVLVSLDAIGHTVISPQLTPHLWSLRLSGGWAPNGGRCDIPAATYVSHATLATGTLPTTHGVTSNRAASKPDTAPGWTGKSSVQAPTLFEVLRGARMRSTAVCGDHHLVRIMGALVANSVWPPGGVLPETTPTCPAGYALNRAVRGPLLDAVSDRALPFLFGHLNESDTWGHQFGPEHPQVHLSYRATDELVGEVIEALRPDWDRVVLIIVSDHGMESVNTGAPIDLLADDHVRAFISDVVDEGGVALARVQSGVTTAKATSALQGVAGVASCRETLPGVLLVHGEPGTVFGSGATKHLRGVHGGPGTTVTTAIVGGGHPAAMRIAFALAEHPPHLADWAPTIAAILGVPFPTAQGRNLAA